MKKQILILALLGMGVGGCAVVNNTPITNNTGNKKDTITFIKASSISFTPQWRIDSNDRIWMYNSLTNKYTLIK